MKTRFVVILLLLNVAALAAGFVYCTQYWTAQTEQDRAAAQTELAAWQARAAAPDVSAPPPAEVVHETNAFQWSQLESTNYQEYIANLRAVGCPERTVKDIILTDVMRLYAQRRGQFYHNGRPFVYWETDEKGKLKQPQIEERDQQLAAIDKELPAVLRELLGLNYEREVNKYFVDVDEDDDRLAFLSEDKRSQALSLRDEFEGKRERILYNIQNGKPSAAEIEELRQVDQSQDEALAQALSPEEKEEYELSMSPTADQLREQLIGFNPTQQEFRTLFAQQKAIDDAYEFEDTSDATVSAMKASDEAQMLASFKESLIGDRVAQFERAHDPEYQSLTLLSARYDLPGDAPATLLDMRQAAEEEKAKLLSNKDVPPERVDAALEAIQAETEKAVRATLGDQAFAQYAPSAAWIKNLGAR
jgi:hypothetical protein